VSVTIAAGWQLMTAHRLSCHQSPNKNLNFMNQTSNF